MKNPMCYFRLCPTILMAVALAAVADVYGQSLAETISGVQPKVVKLFGAGGIRGLEGYQTGILISEDGLILTAWSHVLDDEYLTAVLHDGRRYRATLAGADPETGIAVLKVDAGGLAHFKFEEAVEAPPGTRILAFSNSFGVAAGNEQPSVQEGFIAAKTNLQARRGVWEAAYKGPVYVLDAITSNPGSAGGALADCEGRLLGMLGTELRNANTHTWLNFALPLAALDGPVKAILAGKTASESAATDVLPDRSFDLEATGISLLPRVLESTPPYIDAVKRGSPAHHLGLRPDDLIVLCEGTVIQSAEQLVDQLKKIDARDPVAIGVMRKGEMLRFKLEMPQSSPEEKRP